MAIPPESLGTTPEAPDHPSTSKEILMNLGPQTRILQARGLILAAALLGLAGVVRAIPLTHRSVESASGQMQQSLLGGIA